MRCPKCGFISFDHLENCLKCKKNIQSTSDKLSGSVYNVAAPAFLQFSSNPEPDEVDVLDAFIDDEATFDDEIRDPDLDILLDDSEESEEGEIQFEAEPEEDDSVDFGIADDEDEDDTPSFSLDDFDDDVDFSDSDELGDDESAEGSIAMGLPDELSDMSDLEPPHVPEEPAPELQEVTEDVKVATTDDDFDLDLDFDLNLDDTEESTPAQGGGSLDSLSLGDLQFDDEPAAPATPKKKTPAESMDLDNLNFDLDLGDLKLDEDE